MAEESSAVGHKIRRQVLAASIACVPSMVYGISIGWISTTIPLLQSSSSPSSEPFTDLQISLATSIVSLSAAVSISVFSYLTDKIGRKPTILILSALYALSWGLILLSIEPTMLIIARAIAGSSSGGLFVVVPIYIREVTQDSIRGALGVMLIIGYNLGICIAYGLGILLTYYESTCIYVAIPLIHFVIFFFMPETPVYCVKRQRLEEAAKNLAWLRCLDVNNQFVLEEMRRMEKSDSLLGTQQKVSILSIVKDRPVFRAVCVIVVIAVIQPLSGNFTMVNYASSIFQRANTTLPPAYLGLFVGIVQLFGSIVSANTIERWGRKPLLVGSIVCSMICTATIGTWFLLFNLDIPVPGWIPVAAISISIFGYGLGLGCLVFVIMAEMFSFEHRARVAGIVTILCWCGSFVSLLLFMPIASAFGESTGFFMFSAVAAFGVVFVIICLPETKGKSVEEIQKCFADKTVKCVE